MKKRIAVSLAFLTVLLALSVLPIHGEAELYDSVIRLHVLANSDSDEDQALKLLVRDEILRTAAPLFCGVKTKEEAETVVKNALPALKAAAEKTVAAAGFEAPVEVVLGREHYPTRTYETMAFPAGDYLSLRVLIGEAQGKNWWCVLFPPLCLSAAMGREEQEEAFIEAGLTGEQYRIVTETDSPKYRLRFKILELAENAFSH